MHKDYILPQFGVVTAVDTGACEARVYLPLYNMETDYIKIAKGIPIKQQQLPVKIENVVCSSDGEPVVTYTEGLENGSQVVVVFANGSFDNAVVAAMI